MDCCTRCLSCWKALILTCVSDTWHGLQSSHSVQRPFYICLFQPGWPGRGGGGVWHNMWPDAVTWLGQAPPHPLPPSSTTQTKAMVLNWPLGQNRVEGGGGGKGAFWAKHHTNLQPLEKQRYSEWGSIVSPNLSMGDRIHEQRSMKPPRCPGRRKKPCHGLYNNIVMQLFLR